MTTQPGTTTTPPDDTRALSYSAHAATPEEQRLALHGYILQAEELARAIRLTSKGRLSLAVVNNHGVTLREREGMGWHDAHEAANRVHAE